MKKILCTVLALVLLCACAMGASASDKKMSLNLGHVAIETTPIGRGTEYFAQLLNIYYVGVIMVVNLCIGMLTPPLGANLFVAMRIGGITLEEALKEAIPVILVEILILAIMIMCPWLITFLPNLLM